MNWCRPSRQHAHQFQDISFHFLWGAQNTRRATSVQQCSGVRRIIIPSGSTSRHTPSSRNEHQESSSSDRCSPPSRSQLFPLLFSERSGSRQVTNRPAPPSILAVPLRVAAWTAFIPSYSPRGGERVHLVRRSTRLHLHLSCWRKETITRVIGAQPVIIGAPGWR